ncbi:hypothetical protein HanRHA438_Chr03g0103911 [Helianthus annuus]|uniref:Chemokine interleukin-8-like domain-containing protein n=1 Tax=Helianthus annuus TaxID=4232 RepID=A0A251V7J1_HELAN|nr:hypothetical protein HanXRQr2_Chr03g0092771 [Helianthus annuus]KAF5815052.1 hypothetical protein HanXRQr2_Chr03g0118461 [Helianthus annuus]KAJ0606768.1 hypothetical protein HanHA89_Chr03g0088861 [Helianthus annuus]KAJ0766828.1 hypothetical protein HanLR1_Chr03g0082041 [Helianthus annuus]KAJ0934128.1 hypothetical protein HanRHA438_Chr03g0103911 [Helianthus annuus]
MTLLILVVAFIIEMYCEAQYSCCCCSAKMIFSKPRVSVRINLKIKIVSTSPCGAVDAEAEKVQDLQCQLG